ncbi:MAG: hypothetical protein ACKVOE_10835 [Rickettsiales bacterium]
MENRHDNPDTDIADERYAGPTKAVVAAGNGVFEHLKWAGLGLATAGTLALIAPKQALSVLESARGFATRLKSHDSGKFTDIAKRSLGKIVHTLIGEGKGAIGTIPRINADHQEWLEHAVMNREHGFGHWFVTHTIGALPKVGTYLKNGLLDARKQPAGSTGARITNALTFGGAFGALGYAGGWVGAILHGSRHGSDGKNQLQRAQQEIRDTRELNELLQDQYLEARHEAQSLKTQLAAQKGTLKVAKDETPSTASEQPSTPALLDTIADTGTAETLPPEVTARHVKHTPHTVAAREQLRPPEQHDWAEGVKAERQSSHEPVRA